MKFLFLFLLSLSLPLQLQATQYNHIWGNFKNFDSTSGTAAEQMNLVMTRSGVNTSGNETCKVNDQGNIQLTGGTVNFNFSGAGNPSLATGKAFCMGLTFQAGSFSSTSELSNLFSGQFNKDDSTDPLKMDISYNKEDGTPLFEFVPPSTGSEPTQLTGIDFSQDLTIFINQSESNKLTISFYSGTTSKGSMVFTGLQVDNGYMDQFTIGDANSNMVLKGLGVMINGSMEKHAGWEKEYFDKIGAQSVPEPGAAILALWGGVFVLCRRRRAA